MNEKEILVVHPYLQEMGGAEQVFLNVIKALRETGRVAVLGELPERVAGFQEISCANIISIPYGRSRLGLRRFQVYQKFVRHELLRRGLRKRIGQVGLEVHTQDPMFLLGVGKKKVVYVHYPENLWRLEEPEVHSRSLWRLFYLPMVVALRKQIAGVDLFLCNSEYTKKAVVDKWGQSAEVVYPPVDVESFAPAVKEDFVVSVGRFVRTKNYELVIEVARRMPNVRFVIVGRKRNFDPYYEKINRSKPSNVELMTNVSSDEMAKILGKAKVYLHAMVGEHFGISVVEGMAAGCVPIVHDSGGTREAIGRFGYVYSDVRECVDCVQKALGRKIEPKLIAEHAKRFSSDNFRRAFIDTLKSKGFL